MYLMTGGAHLTDAGYPTRRSVFTPERPGVTTYLAYPSPGFYLTKTAAWVEKFVDARRGGVATGNDI